MPVDPAIIVELTDASLAADYTRVRRAANAAIRQLMASGEESSADRLRSLLRKRAVPLRASGHTEQLPVDLKSRLPLIEEQQSPSGPVFLSERDGHIIADFVYDVQNASRLADHGISARHNLILSGAPGTGKTSLAGHIAAQLGRPLYVLRLDSLISSLLGDTAKNVRAVFDYFNHKGGVLFLDEMDAVAKLRDDRHELGELKRVVNTVIQSLDSSDEHSVVIAATNHPQLLDPAIWRRFPYKLELPLPNEDVRAEMWNFFLFRDQDSEIARCLSDISAGLSGADIQTIAYTARRNSLLSEGASVDLAAVTDAILESKAGSPVLPTRQGVSHERRRSLATRLVDRGLNAPRVGQLLGVSRQWALRLMKEGENDE